MRDGVRGRRVVDEVPAPPALASVTVGLEGWDCDNVRGRRLKRVLPSPDDCGKRIEGRVGVSGSENEDDEFEPDEDVEEW